MFGTARLSIAPLPAFGEHDNPLTRGLPAGTLHPHSRLPASRGVNCTRQVTGHEAADHRLLSSSPEPSGLTSAGEAPQRGGTGSVRDVGHRGHLLLGPRAHLAFC